jgi:hypothetical protein
MWNHATDKKVQKKIYDDINSQMYENDIYILDIGIESYNVDSKLFFNNEKIKYFQLDPNGIFTKNDGFLHCKAEDSSVTYPEFNNFFDIILDFGVFGWNGVRLIDDERKKYINNIFFLLKNDGTYILHSDREKRNPLHEIDFETQVYSVFSSKKFLGFENNLVINCPNYGTTWDIQFLKKND